MNPNELRCKNNFKKILKNLFLTCQYIEYCKTNYSKKNNKNNITDNKYDAGDNSQFYIVKLLNSFGKIISL